MYVSRVVMSKVIGRELKLGEVVHHKDEDRTNNNPSNLRLMMHGEHSAYHRRGTKRSEKILERMSLNHPNRKLSPPDVNAIRKMLIKGIKSSIIGNKYSVSPSTIRNIKAGNRWAWLKE